MLFWGAAWDARTTSERLLTTDWTVHRIALASDFATPSRFYDAFTRLLGTTPRAYRLATSKA